MGVFEIVVISIGLAMDAFAVAICKGLSMMDFRWKNAVKVGLYFGLFQAVMPVIGYFLGTTFSRICRKYRSLDCFYFISTYRWEYDKRINE